MSIIEAKEWTRSSTLVPEAELNRTGCRETSLIVS